MAGLLEMYSTSASAGELADLEVVIRPNLRRSLRDIDLSAELFAIAVRPHLGVLEKDR